MLYFFPKNKFILIMQRDMSLSYAMGEVPVTRGIF